MQQNHQISNTNIAVKTFLQLCFCLLFATSVIGAEPWKRHTIDNTSRGADGVRLLDINGDGLLDIATGWEEGGSIRLYTNPGPKAVTKKWPGVVVGSIRSPEDAVIADIDGDGQFDVVSCCEGKTKSIFIHWSPTRDIQNADSWRTTAIPIAENKQLWMFAVPVDLNGDGLPEIVAGSKGGNASVSVLSAVGDPREMKNWRMQKLVGAGWIMSLQLHDMNGDNEVDILVSDRKGAKRGVYWLQNPGKKGGVWKRQEIGGADREVMFLARGDINGDGRPDIITAVKGKPLTWFRLLENDTWATHEIPMPENCGGGKGVAIGDMNGDGHADIAFTCESATNGRSGARWLEAKNGDYLTGDWVDHEISGPAGVKFDRIELVDFDSDGDLDLLTCEERENLGVIWYENPTN